MGVPAGGDTAPFLLWGLRQPQAKRLKVPTLWIAQTNVKRMVPKGTLGFSSICVFKSCEDFRQNYHNKKKIEIMLFVDLMISKISCVRNKCKSVCDDIYAKFHMEK